MTDGADQSASGGFHRVCESLHRSWDPTADPAVEIESGEVVELGAPDASDDQITPHAVASDLASVDFARANPVAGPVFVRGARPGDAIEAEVLEVRTRDWGWTAIAPGYGLLADDFPDPWLRISRISHGRVLFGDGLTLPYRPFPGTIGVAPAGPDPHPILPPSRFGGNMDVAELTAGTRLLLPVGVEGALLSAGDGHALQGEGEVCGSAIETGMQIALRLTARRDLRLSAPQLIVPASASAEAAGGHHLTLGVAGDLLAATRDAVRALIDHLARRFRLEPTEAYALISVAGRLRIHEVVNAPNWVVGASVPEAILAGR